MRLTPLAQVGMSEMQRKFYKSLLQKDIDVIQAGNDRSRLLNVVMQLRKASPPCPCGCAAGAIP